MKEKVPYRVVSIVSRQTCNLLLIALASLAFASSCHTRNKSFGGTSAVMIDSLIPQYSHSFRVDYYKGYQIVRVFNKKSSTSYLLYSDTSAIASDAGDMQVIPYPAAHIICMSTTHMGAMELLGTRSVIAAATNKDFVCDSLIRTMMTSGTVKDAGKDYQPDYEVIAEVKPDLLFSDGENNGAVQMYAKLKALGIKVVSSRDYYEQEPLARAEWIKFFAAFIGKEKMADSIFETVKANYLNQKEKNVNLKDKPTVFCNVPYSGVWYMPCGENYPARLISDAGGDFLWNNDKPINGLNLTLNFEEVYLRASNADFWVNTGVISDIAQLTSADLKFKMFQAYKTGQVFNCTKRTSPNGSGLDMWETGPYRPDIALHDLALIFHQPPSWEDSLYYYQRLK